MAGRCSMAAIALAIAVTATHGPRSAAQSPRILPFHVPTAVNVERVLGLKYGTNQSGNAARINAGLLASASTYRGPWCFNGGGTTQSGLLWINDGTIGEVEPRVHFDGSLFTASAEPNSATVTIVGWPVTASDVGRRIRITGGTGWLFQDPHPKFATVDSVNAGTNQWTFDRVVSGDGGGSGLVGFVDPPSANRMPQVSGRVFAGPGGRGSVDNEGSLNIGPTIRIVQQTPPVVFNGTDVRAAAPADSNVLTLSGHSVTSLDRGRTLHITGGAGFITGYYVVVATQGSNVWKLDRKCTNPGTEGEAMQGRAMKALWADHGFGSVYSGIEFRAHPFPYVAPDYRQDIGLHVKSALVLEDISTGKHRIENCTFSQFIAGVLFGRDLRRAHQPVVSPFPSVTYVGDGDSHADDSWLAHNYYHGCKAGVHVRTGQGVNYRAQHEHFVGCETCYYFERGGECTIDQPTIAGDNSTLLRIGTPSAGYGSYKIIGGGFDAGNANGPRILQVDAATGTAFYVEVDGVNIDSQTNLSRPLFVVKSGCRLVVKGVQRLRPGTFECYASSDGRWKPTITLIGCHLEDFDDPTEATEDLLSAASPTGMVIETINCSGFWDHDGNPLTDEVWTDVNERYVK